MRSRHIIMSLAQFRLLPRDPGWRYEYFDEMAHVTPRARFATVRVGVGPRPLEPPLPLRSVVASDREELLAAYVAAFADSVEYCDVPAEGISRSARENIRDFYAGDRGEALPSSCVAVDDAAEDPVEVVAGAALVTRAEDGCPLLDMLFVRPRWQRRGLAAALVSWSLRELLAQGEAALRSRYLLGNEPSRAWHQHFGFTLEPDPDGAEGSGRIRSSSTRPRR
jgi:GNAT superfamily N-acetyltransferase